MPLSFGRNKEPSFGVITRLALSANQKTAGLALPVKEPQQKTAEPALLVKMLYKEKLRSKKKAQLKKKINKKASIRSSTYLI
jgi:hypothetical protein